MKKLILILMLFLVKNSFSQYNLNFTYDDNGNRITREIIYMTPHRNQLNNFDSTNIKPFTAKLDSIKIDIYPNPTTEILKIKISELSAINNGHFYLYDRSGKLLYQNAEIFTDNQINMDELPTGIYVLVIEINEVKKEWNVVKK